MHVLELTTRAVPQTYNSTLVYLLARDLSSSKQGLILSTKGPITPARGLEFGFQGLHQPPNGLGPYLACFALTHNPGLECTDTSQARVPLFFKQPTDTTKLTDSVS